MSIDIRGTQLQPVTSSREPQLTREIQQFTQDVTREIELRRFYKLLGTQKAFLVQMDKKGRLVWYCKKAVTVTNKSPKQTVWRKVADLDCDGNLRIRGTLTQSVAFDESEDL